MKNLKNLGKTLNRKEQKEINGGTISSSCLGWSTCTTGSCEDPNHSCTRIPCPNPSPLLNNETYRACRCTSGDTSIGAL